MYLTNILHFDFESSPKLMVDFTHISTVMFQSWYSRLAQSENYRGWYLCNSWFLNIRIINVAFIKINTVSLPAVISSHIKNKTMVTSNELHFEFIS